MAVMRLTSVSARYRVPLDASATPVGPIASAVGESTHGIPSAITCSLRTFGACSAPDSSTIRTTVELLIVWTPLAAPPLSTMLTNIVVLEPSLTAVEPHGPWMLALAIVFTTLPLLSSTIRQPYLAVADLPLVVGRLPTTTNPPGRMFSAFVSPTPPGHAPGSVFASSAANGESLPEGVICTIV